MSIVMTASTLVAASSATATVTHQRWDPGVAAIAKKVEQLRGLRFLHPVPITYLRPKAFDRKLAPKPSAIRYLAKWAVRLSGRFRAFGFVTGTVDPAKFAATAAAPAVAFYSPKDKRIYVRGRRVNVVTAVVLAHELTHALQDQHFGILRLEHAVHSNDAGEALTGLIEGDATFIEHEYLAQLDDDDQAAYAAAARAAGPRVPPEVAAGLHGLPELRSAFVHAPYFLGEQMVALVAELRGEHGVNELFRHPPRTASAYISPVTLLSHRPALRIVAPHLRDGELEDVPPGPLESMVLYLMLAGRIEPADALTAVDGLAGGEELDFHRGDVACTRIAVAGTTTGATATLARALSRWAAAMPVDVATVTSSRSRVVVTSCDPRKAATGPSQRASFAISFDAARNAMVNRVLSQAHSLPEARCVGDRMMRLPIFRAYASATADRLPASASLSAALALRTDVVAARCAVTLLVKQALS